MEHFQPQTQLGDVFKRAVKINGNFFSLLQTDDYKMGPQ
jgi:hypothetical protein